MLRFSIILVSAAALAQGPYLPEGLRIGEVTDKSAVVRFRLSPLAAPNPGKYESPKTTGERALMLPDDVDPWKLPAAVPGIVGRARLWLGMRADLKDAKPLEWLQAEAARDYALHVPLTGLKAAKTYHLGVEINAKPTQAQASFTTAPEARQRVPVTFTAVTGLMYRDLDHPQGFNIFEAMLKSPPAFLVLTGDNVYYDNEPPRAVNAEVARYHWQRMYALPRAVALFAKVPQYWMKDDHDTLSDDCWPGMDPDWMKPMTFAEGQKIFLEQVPVMDKTFRTFRWGKGLQIWLPEGRDYRSPNNAPDGPSKTILGAEQKAWLKNTVDESDADWKIIISPTPWIGPDRANKNDNYANAAFATEGKEMRAWAAQKKNVIVVCGDRHWQYHSVDPATGLHELSTGPASDEHAGGSPGEDKTFHKFHRVKGGYASVSVQPAGATSKLTLKLHDVNGAPVYEFSPQ
jgi:alkaline phosphatase D